MKYSTHLQAYVTDTEPESVFVMISISDAIVIGSCGPTALIDDASRAVGRVSRADWRDVGGVESIEEYVLQNEN